MHASVGPPGQARSTETREQERELESFSRDLLVLAKTLSVYPDGHPATLRVATRLAEAKPAGNGEACALGITPTRFLHANQFFGSEGSRIEALATLFHGKRLMRLRWDGAVSVRDVTVFAGLLSNPKAEGTELADQLVAAGVRAIAVDPLDITKIHGALSAFGEGAGGLDAGAERELDAWLWLQDDALQPEVLAQALGSEAFWALSEGDPSFCVRLVFQHRGKMDQALGLLPDERRQAVRGKLARFGREYPVADLASLALAEVEGRNPGFEGVSHLLEELSPEALLELMARVVAQADGSASRALSFFHRFGPRCDPEQMLALIEAREQPSAATSHPLEIWRNLKVFFLELDEEKFFGDDYLAELGDMGGEAGEEGEQAPPEALSEFAQDAEPHLDIVCLGLAGGQRTDAVLRFERRLGARLLNLSAPALLQFAGATSRAIPGFFASRSELTKDVFGRVLAGVRLLDPQEKREAIEFARCHEAVILDPAITALIRERRVAGRRFLVDLLSALSDATTGQLVGRACDAPWYYTRNVATILGRRRERDSAPVLQALLDHPHDRVRKEALKALGQMGGAARTAVQQFADDLIRGADERALAKRILHRKEAAP